MDVEAFGVTFAIAPRNDVRGAKKSRIGDAGERAAALPIVDQSSAKNVLADPLGDEPFGLGRLGEVLVFASNSLSGASGRLTPTRRRAAAPYKVRRGC